MSEIYSLVYQPGKSVQEEPYHFNRTRVDRVNLIAGEGIEGDFKSGHNPRRQLNILSYETVLALKAEGYKTEPGELGEQIVIRGVDVASLQAGAQLQFGAEAIVEVIGLREPCEWFGRVQGKDFNEVIGRVGVMAAIVRSGMVYEGDAVRVLETAANQVTSS